MKWNYKCHDCSTWLFVEWEERGEMRSCPNCKNKHYVPRPEEEYEAYVDQHEWPQEMEDAVHILKGKTCIIKNCPHKNATITLDHILAWDNRGKTSVENLQPMCQPHNSSKGTKDFKEWLDEEGLTAR